MARKVCYPAGTLQAPVDPDTGLPVPLAPQPIIPPYSSTRPPQAKDFWCHFEGTLAAGAGSAVLLAPVVGNGIVIPTGAELVLEKVSLGVILAGATTQVFGRVLWNNGPVAGLGAIVVWPVAAALSAVELEPGTWLRGGGQLTIRAENFGAAGPWTVCADLGGYFYMSSDRLGRFGDNEG